MDGPIDSFNPKDFSLIMGKEDTPLGGYPISRYVYGYVKKSPPEYENCNQAWYLVKFLEWTYTNPLAEEIALGHGG